MKHFKCHKEVDAFKIEAITYTLDSEAYLYEDYDPADDTKNSLRILVSKEYMKKHNPKAGGYYVRYADGYESFSPADVFEAGYTEIESEQKESHV